MAKEYKDVVVGLDIGTSKVMAVVAEVLPNGALKLAGLGVAPSSGLKRGAVVNIVDIHAERPLQRYPLYSAAKAGLAGLTRALAIELAPEARVNGVSPGPIDWPEDEQFTAEERQQIVDHTLLKRVGSAADIARTVRFLMFDAPYITGQIIAVDGGRSAHL